MKKNSYVDSYITLKGIKKILLKMKIILLLTAITAISVKASVYSQNTYLNLEANQISIREVLNLIETQSDLRFFYNDEFTDLNKTVNMSFKEEKLDIILNQLLEDSGLGFRIFEDNVVVITPVGDERMQDLKVTGRVIDAGTGDPLPGVNILLEGTTHGVTTDLDGKYSIALSENNMTLIFSYIGYITKMVTYSGQTSIDVELALEIQSLEEVIVVGYGMQKRGNLTGSISSIKSDNLVKTPVVSASNTLAGRLPGLVSKQQSGQPGYDAASLSVRGFGSSLVIVDGVEGNLNNIDPNQIESISILKDGAGSIYGSRAGNGVILITTKRGYDQKPIITLNTSVAWQGITTMPKSSSAGQYAELEREAWLQAGKPEETAPYTAEQVQKYYDGTDPQFPNTNWYDYLIRDWAPQQQHNLSIRGGSEKIKYYGFIGYIDQESIWKRNGGNYKRYNLQSNIDAKITDNLSLQLDLASAIENRDYPWRPQSQGRDNVWQDFWFTLPTYPAELPDKTKISFADGGGTGGAHTVTNSEIAGYNNTDEQDLKGTIALNYRIKWIEGLSAKALFNYNQIYSANKNFVKPLEFYTYDVASDTYTLAGALYTQAELRTSRTEDRMITEQFSLNYDHTFMLNHHLSALGLIEIIDYKNDWISAGRSNYITDAIDQLFAGSSTHQFNDGAASEMGRKSYVGRLNYAYKNKYLFESTFRADASAKFPSDKRWGYFPSVSVGWVMTEENFMNKIGLLDNLKLRASYGISGNDAVGNFQYLSGYIYGATYMFNSLVYQGLMSTGLANPNLTWEEMTIYNVGLDFSLWNRRLYGEGDVFYRYRSGVPATRITTLPSTFGASLPPENINSLNDRGFELMLGNSGNLESFSWDVNANLSWSRAKWDHYEEPEYTDPEQERIYKLSGRWTDRVYGYLSDGLFANQDQIDELTFNQDLQDNISLRPGDIKYINTNGDDILDWKDQVEIGKGTMPHWMMGLNINLKYKNFDLSSLFQGAFGYYSNITFPENTFATRYDLRWTPENNDVHALVPRLGGAATNNYFSDYYYKKAGYIRLKMINVGYNFPQQWLQKVKVNELRIYLAGTNLITLDKLKEYRVDPEAPSGVTGYYYPQQKVVTIGVNLSF